MRNLIRKQLWLTTALALALPLHASAAPRKAPADNAGGLGSGSAAARRSGSQAATGSQAAGNVNGGLGASSAAARRGSQVAGSQAAGGLGGSSAAARRGGGGSTVAGSTVAGSQAAGGLGASSAAARRGGSAVVTLPGSQVASGSQALGRSSAAARGSQVASRAASLSGAAASSGAPRGSSRGAFRALVPAVSNLPKLSSQAPGMLFVIADDSTSMDDDFNGQPGVKKADALADVVNRVLGGFVSRHNVGGRIKNRLHVAVEGYNSGNDFTNAMGGKGIATLEELADGADIEDIEDNEGNMVPTPTWARATANGSTPMASAFRRMRGTLNSWQARPGQDHLVLGIHVTDGDHDRGEDPSDEMANLASEVSAKGGKLLMTNIHLSSSGGASVLFPTDADIAHLGPQAKLLFEMSSPVPPQLAEKLKTKPGARMMAYNTTVEEFEKVFEAGSSVAAQ